MTSEEIIEIADICGIDDQIVKYWLNELERFAALVAEKELEACAKECEEMEIMWTHMARGATDAQYDYKADGAMECAAAIRARNP